MARISRKVVVRGTLTALLLCLMLVLFYRPVEVGDDWWHIAVGRWIAEQHAVPVTDPFPFSGEKSAWLHTHWLGSFILYEAYQWTGLEGLKILRAGYFLLVVGIFFIYFYRKIPFSLLLLVAVFLANGLSTRHFLRPDLCNFFFVQIVLILLLHYERCGKGRWLCIFPFLGLLWFNMHLGAAIYGTSLLFIFILSLGVGALLRRSADPDGAATHWRRAIALVAALLAFWASFLFTPLGWNGLVSQLQIFFTPGDPRLFYETLKFIGEAQPPQLFRWGVLWFWGLAALGLGFLFWNRSRKLSHILLFVVSLGFFLCMQRNGGFFALVAAYVIADNATALGLLSRPSAPRWQRLLGRLFVWGSLVVFSSLMWDKLWIKEVHGGREARRVLQRMDDLPLANGVDFLRVHKMVGPVFNTNILTGGYLLWAGYPELRPFLDGRSIEFQRLIESQAVMAGPEKYWPMFEKKYKVDIILGHSDKLSRRFFRYINASPEWKLVFVQGSLLIFIRSQAFVLPTELAGYADRLRAVGVSPDDVAFMVDTYRRPRGGRWEDWLNPPPVNVDDWEAGVALLSMGYDGAGVQKVVGGLRQGFVGTGREIPQVLRLLKSRGLIH